MRFIISAGLCGLELDVQFATPTSLLVHSSAVTLNNGPEQAWTWTVKEHVTVSHEAAWRKGGVVAGSWYAGAPCIADVDKWDNRGSPAPSAAKDLDDC